jgi:BASS family bile acid:Na+ symporter
MFICAFLGFILPQASAAVFPFLPYVLFFLMTLSMIGTDQNRLMRELSKPACWMFALLHSFGFMLLSALCCYSLGVDDELTLAIVAVAATGSLFATPAIVKAIGFDTVFAMAMTITTTLILPISLFVTLFLFQQQSVSLDMYQYGLRLVIFIFGPMLLSLLMYRYIPTIKLKMIHQKISPFTIVLVFFFPFGLIGDFRGLWQTSSSEAYQYLMIACALCFLFFAITYFIYKRSGEENALISAITAGNRNVLLSYTVAGSLLGPAFLPLVGALQIPTYFLPMAAKFIAKHKTKNKC